jgi:hypothetical protein
MNWYKISQIVSQTKQTMGNLGSPNINISPYDNFVKEAVDELKQEQPGIFNQVTDIIVDVGYGQFGSVQSPSANTIRINLNRIRDEVRKMLPGTTENDPKYKEILKNKIKEVLVHEHAHILDMKTDEGGNISFPGNETPANRAQEQFVQSHPIQL